MTGSARRELGRSGIEVSPVAIGCWPLVGDFTWGPQKEEDAVTALRDAFDAGINFFDTAEAYGDGYSEELLARVLGDVRDRIVIGSKVSDAHVTTRKRLNRACEDSLRRLRTDYIDVYHLHWPCRAAPVAEVVEGFLQLQDAGKIRCFAVSNFGSRDLSELLQCGRCEVNQLPYSLIWRAIEFGILSACREREVSVTCYSPLMQGLLTGKFKSAEDVPDGRARTRLFSPRRPNVRHGEAGCEEEVFAALRTLAGISSEIGVPMAEVALAWLLHQPGVASVLVGVRNPEQVRQNARAAELELTPEILARLDAATIEVKRRVGPNPDMWQSASRYC